MVESNRCDIMKVSKIFFPTFDRFSLKRLRDLSKYPLKSSVFSPGIALQCSGIKKWCLYQIFQLLIGFQTANENHLKSHEVAGRVTMYVFTDKNQCFYSTSVHCFLHHHRVGVKSESRSNKDELGKVSREKLFFFLSSCWCQEREWERKQK